MLPHLRGSAGPHAQMMRFLLLTLARRDAAATATWANVNLDATTWTIAETKNGQPHVVPLSRQAVALLVGLGKGSRTRLVFSTRTGEKLGNWDRAYQGYTVGQRDRRMEPPRSAAPGARCSARWANCPTSSRQLSTMLFIRSPLGRDLQPQPLPAASRRGAATACGRAGRDRTGVADVVALHRG